MSDREVRLGNAPRRLLGVIVLIVAMGITVVATGCSSGGYGQAGSPKTAGSVAPAASEPATAGVAAASDLQVCTECAKKGMPAKVKGASVVSGDVQIIDIAIAKGTYAPNIITAKAGIPVRVVFTGKAKGCLAKPTFKSLGKNLDLTGTGGGTLELGKLKPGVYKFTCGMGMNPGTITVQ